MFNIFNEKKIERYFDENNRKIRKEINQLSESNVLSLNIELTAQRLLEEYKITTPTLESENCQTVFIYPKQISSRISTESKVMDDIQMAKFYVPFIGNGELFKYIPSKASSGLFQAEELLKNSITIQFTNEDIILGNHESREKIDAKFSGFLDYLKYNLNSINNDVTAYNNELFNVIKKYLDEKDSSTISKSSRV